MLRQARDTIFMQSQDLAKIVQLKTLNKSLGDSDALHYAGELDLIGDLVKVTTESTQLGQNTWQYVRDCRWITGYAAHENAKVKSTV